MVTTIVGTEPKDRMNMQRLVRVAVVAVVAACTSDAGAIDLHEYWDKNCGTCHGHAGAFARRFLSVEDGKLRGRHHVDNLEVFLANHYLRRDLVAPVSNMLIAQASNEPRFQKECGRCHENAAALARESLALRDGVLVSRASGRPTAEFLSGHARIKPADVPFFVDVLTRVTKEVGVQ
jgi:hypothetical protein